jgi:putative inorganic carbon (HCO3(-)) transporter
MSLTLIVWLTLLVILTLLSFRRPSWGIAVYMLTYFAFPGIWWWGKTIAHHRWALVGGCTALGAVLISLLKNQAPSRHQSMFARVASWAALGMLINATFVQLVLAERPDLGAEAYWYLAKFVLLFFLITLACRSREDLRIVLLSIVLGAGYIGYEVTINDRGKVVQGRLEGVGAPGANGANQCASLMVTVLPLTGAFFMAGRRWEKLAMLPVAPFILNVILLCNSRGAFLACFAMVGTLLVLASNRVRKQILILIALGLIALYLLLGDTRIVERFKTTFRPADERDASAADRLEYWKAGLRMIADYPLGAGGYGFKYVHGPKYIAEVNDQYFEARSVHNGYINEACEWGIQGLCLRMLFVTVGLYLAWRMARHGPQNAPQDDVFARLVALCLLAGQIAFLVTSIFGSHLDSEWGYWMVALSVAHVRVYGVGSHSTVQRSHSIAAPMRQYNACVPAEILVTR